MATPTDHKENLESNEGDRAATKAAVEAETERSNFDFTAIQGDSVVLAISQMRQAPFAFTMNRHNYLKEEHRGALLAWTAIEKLGMHWNGPGMSCSVASFARALSGVSKKPFRQMAESAEVSIAAQAIAQFEQYQKDEAAKEFSDLPVSRN